MPPPSMRELFVISDLHIGGKTAADGQRGFCINTHVPLLVQFIGKLAQRASTRAAAIELVINGDFFDFLAEEAPMGAHGPWSAFIDDPVEAVGAYRNIRCRHAALFDELRALLAAGGDLTLLLGNHDIELSLPAVRGELLADLEAGTRGRVRFVYDGEAYVPAADVLIEHGNRYDGFNVVDHHALRVLRSVQSRRMPMPDDVRFVPPPGSRLVEQVMNPIKRDFPFVDLLKPEKESVIPLLLALDPGRLADVRAVLALRRLQKEAESYEPREPAVPHIAGRVGTRSVPPAQTQERPQAEDDPVATLLAEQLGPADAAKLLALATPRRGPARQAPGRIGTAGFGTWLEKGWSLLEQAVGSRAEQARLKVLLPALRRLQHDSSFDTGHELPEVMDSVRRLSQAGFRVVLLGHTHLAKAVVEPGLTYLNTGTWADLMRLPATLFDRDRQRSHAALEQFVAHLRARCYEPYLVFEPHFAHVVIGADGRAASAQLHRFDPARGLPPG